MPTYLSRCGECGKHFEYFSSIDARDDLLPTCCGGKTSRIMPRVPAHGFFEPFVSPKSGKLISSKTELDTDLKATGSFLWEPGVDRDIARNREHEWKKTESLISEKVDTVVRDLHNSGKLES